MLTHYLNSICIWRKFANILLYNGPGYAKNQYDTKMANEARLAKQLLGLT